MNEYSEHSKALLTQGFTVINGIYSADEIKQIGQIIDNTDHSNDTFRKTSDLFAIRKCLNEVPQLLPIIFNTSVKEIVSKLFGQDYFVVKSIYFDKPIKSNWFVALHRDLTISVDKKLLVPGFSNWTVKNNQFAVQPPPDILKENFTIPIHLDDTDASNGALKVIPASHLDNEISYESGFDTDRTIICDVEEGGLMIMRPLLLHASNRTVGNRRRRVLHIEFSNAELPNELKWSEKIDLELC